MPNPHNETLIIGLMSGTSADGIDAAVVGVRGSGTSTKVRQIAFRTFSYPRGFKKFLLENSDSKTARLDNIVRLNMLVGELFADAAKGIAKKAGVRLTDIDLIGSHGQTICHLPEIKKLFGKQIRGTLQIGDPAVIAKRTGIPTVGDFRVADIAVGGSGAPLVPYVDYLLFRSTKVSRILLNIGGIANMTVLPKNCRLEDLSAFDTGPGNMLIDLAMQQFYKKGFDEGGAIAQTGVIIPGLLSKLSAHRYLSQKPPKSTGREMFGEVYFIRSVRGYSKVPKQDIIATLTEFTALSIYRAYKSFVKTRIMELIVSGGGIHNAYLMDALKR